MTNNVKFWIALENMHNKGTKYLHQNAVYTIKDNQLVYINAYGAYTPTTKSFNQLMNFDWDLYDEPGHDWAWAWQQLKQGKQVRRKAWGDLYKGSWCWNLNDKGELYWGTTCTNGEVTISRILSEKAFDSKDWVTL